jgi:hypothetical protein
MRHAYHDVIHDISSYSLPLKRTNATECPNWIGAMGVGSATLVSLPQYEPVFSQFGPPFGGFLFRRFSVDFHAPWSQDAI